MIIRRFERHLTAETLPKDLAALWQKDYDSEIVAALLDNSIHDLQTPIGAARSLEFVELNSDEGYKIYARTVQFLALVAIGELYPTAEATVHFMVNRGLYITVKFAESDEYLTTKRVSDIESKMREIIAQNRPIIKDVMPKDAAAALFEEKKQFEKAHLIAALDKEKVSVYRCGEFYDYMYGAMMSATGHLGKFSLSLYGPGMLLRTPSLRHNGEVPAGIRQAKLREVLAEAKEWAGILNCKFVTDLNRAVENGSIGEIIKVSEALQEKKIAHIADHVAKCADSLRLILIAGPSSSGKTSFAQRLRIQLKASGLKPVSISLDDYFVDREITPKNERGEYDYECLDALNVSLFNEHMVALLKGETVHLPRYNFLTGKSELNAGAIISVTPEQPIIIEGIHGLNERLTAAVPRDKKYKIYISALMQLNIDAHNRIPTTEARLLRRLVRDHRTRGASAVRTLKMWNDVRAGEEKYIFPFQEEADVMFNSALIYELAVLKPHAVPLLASVTKDLPEYTKARRLLDFCQYFTGIPGDKVPSNSLLREFIGASALFDED